METLSESVLWGFDLIMAALLLGLSWRLMRCRDVFTAVVLFIAFGLVMALVWVRLNAPDVALAEIAIGAGVTGALLLTALARLEHHDTVQAKDQNHAP